MVNSSKSNKADKSISTADVSCGVCNTRRLITFYAEGKRHFTNNCVKCGDYPSTEELSSIRTHLVSSGKLIEEH